MKIKSAFYIFTVLFASAITLSACSLDQDSASRGASSVTGAPTITSIPSVSSLTPTAIPVETDENLQKLIESDKDTGFDAEFQKLQEDLK